MTFSKFLEEHDGPCVAMAHRRELGGQMSLTLARFGIRHNIIAPAGAIREIVTLHMQESGRSFYDAAAPCAVAGVHTLVNRDLGAWADRVGLWVCDEAHHLTVGTVWHKATQRFPNARGLGVTATSERLDGKGLGRHADGIMDALVLGPDMRWLIEAGNLVDYRIFAPQSDINLVNLPISATTGDYSLPALRDAAKRSHITGDMVESYLKIARGKLGVSFCVSVELAIETAARFRAAGVPAEVVSSNTPELVRAAIMRKFAKREILQLVNVDLFGEGFDLPALEVVSLGRPSKSYGLVMQQIGRVLRPMAGKEYGIVIDHVRNIVGNHGLPDAPRVWTLDRRERKSRGASDGEIPVRSCPACTGVYERVRHACPYCNHVPEPASREAPEFVDGDLLELDSATLARLRQGVDAIMEGQPKIPYGASPVVVASIRKRHREMQQAQRELRSVIATWAGWQKAQGRSDSASYRSFYFQFGVDVASAQTLGTREADDLRSRVTLTLTTAGVVV